MKIKQLQTAEKKVRKILIERPDARDSHNLTIAKYWLEENMDYFNRNKYAMDVLRKIASDQFTPPETILRAKRKVQEREPELRGKNYVDRKLNAEEIRQTINIHNEPKAEPKLFDIPPQKDQHE